MTIAIEILILLLLLLLLYAQWKGKPLGRMIRGLKRKVKQGDAERAAMMESVAADALHALHCDVNWETDKSMRTAHYDYQNGHFQLRIDPSSPYASLAYLYCLDVPMSQIGQVRTIVNKCNINSDNPRIIYTVNGEKNVVNLHIMSGIRLHKDNVKEVLTGSMSSAFAWQNILSRHLIDSDAQKNHDAELETAEMKRQIFLLHEHEIRLQSDEPFVNNDTDRMRLGQFLDKVMGLTRVTALRLEFPGTEQDVLTDSEEILDYDMTYPLYRDGRRVATQAVAMLQIAGNNVSDKERLITLTFNEEGSDEKTDYFRVTTCLVPFSATPSHPLAMRHITPVGFSVLLAYDHTSRRQQRDESLYMWKEAVQKLSSRKEDELTDDQKLLAECTDGEVAHMLYKGKKLYLDGRFYEALLHLENAYYHMRREYDRMSDDGQQGFYDLIYEIGYCYSELMMYDRALFYLGMLYRLNRITYTMEYVNCLVNSRDFRAQQTIEELIAGVKINFEDEEPPEYIHRFLSFLQRRKVYMLINKEQYRKAQRMLKKMLNEPENADFALNELAYIEKKMKGEG